MALSSTKGEYIALMHTAKEAIWIQEFLGEVFPDFAFPTTILGDNQGALVLAVNPAFHTCTKHICICHHFIHDSIKAEDVDLEYMLTGNQVVDIFTKGLPSIKHKKFTSMMGLAEVGKAHYGRQTSGQLLGCLLIHRVHLATHKDN